MSHIDEKKSEEKIRRAFKERDWSEIKSADSWAIFKVMSEFVEGFEKLAKIGPCVTIFGSARTPRDHHYYKTAEEIAAKLVQHGYGVITGGGPGYETDTTTTLGYKISFRDQDIGQSASMASINLIIILAFIGIFLKVSKSQERNS